MEVLHVLVAFSCLVLHLNAQPSPPVAKCDSSNANKQISDQNGLYWCGGDGRKQPLACLAPDGSRIDTGATYWTDAAILECRLTGDTLQLASVACLKNGRRVEIDGSINDGRFFYKCTRQQGGSTLALQPTGCVGSDGSEVPPGTQVNQGSFLFTCSMDGAAKPVKPPPAQPGPPATTPAPQKGGSSGGQPQLTAAGCSFNGRQYKLGDDMELSGAWYQCSKDASSGAPTSTLVGCVVNGTKYKMGQTWRDEFFAFRCEKIGGFVMSNAYACVERYPNGTTTEYAPGRKWIVGSGSFNRYVISCTKQGIQLRRRGIACYYMTNEGQGVLDAACMKKVGGVLIQCWQPGPTPNVRIRITENPTSADDQRLAAAGLHYCESKPLESVIN